MIEALIARVAWSSTYTYILLLFVAAAFVAYIGRPRRHGEVVKRLYAGELLESFPDGTDGASGPVLRVECKENGRVVFGRFNVDRLTASGAVSIAVTVNGKDVEIIERDTAGYSDDPVMAGARFDVDLSGSEWRHIKWSDDDSGLWCAFSLHLRPGIAVTVPMKR